MADSGLEERRLQFVFESAFWGSAMSFAIDKLVVNDILWEF